MEAPECRQPMTMTRAGLSLLFAAAEPLDLLMLRGEAG